MTKSQFRYGKKLIQAWVPEDLLESSCFISKKNVTETVTEALIFYIKGNKTELELAEERFKAALNEMAESKAHLDKVKEKLINNDKKEKQNNAEIKKEIELRKLSEKEKQETWELKIKPLIKKKISASGIQSVLDDERMLNNFSRALCISTGELKEKISTEMGVV